MQTNVPSGRNIIKQVAANFLQAIEMILGVVGRFQWPGSSCLRDDGLAPIGKNHVSINSTEKKIEVYANIFIYACSYVIASEPTRTRPKHLLEETKII